MQPDNATNNRSDEDTQAKEHPKGAHVLHSSTTRHTAKHPHFKVTSAGTIAALVLLLLIILFSMVYFVQSTDPNESEADESSFTQPRSVLDRVELRPVEGANIPNMALYSEALNRVVYVAAEPSRSYEAEVFPKDASFEITQDLLLIELGEQLFEEGYTSVPPANSYLAQEDNMYGAKRYVNDVYECTLTVYALALPFPPRESPYEYDGDPNDNQPIARVLKQCADTSDVDAIAAEQTPFYEAYAEEYGDEVLEDSYGLFIFVDTADIEESSVSGYENVRGSVSTSPLTGAGVYFVRETDGAWQYGFAFQEGINCSFIEDDIARRALADITCFDETNELTTIKEFYDL